MLAATIMPISTAFVICEAFGWESGVDKRFGDARAFFSIYTFVLVAGALIVLLPGLDLLPVIVASQNLQGLLLPIVLVFMVVLVNDKRLMGRHRNGRVANVLAWSAVGLVVVLDVVLLGVSALGCSACTWPEGAARRDSASRTARYPVSTGRGDARSADARETEDLPVEHAVAHEASGPASHRAAIALLGHGIGIGLASIPHDEWLDLRMRRQDPGALRVDRLPGQALRPSSDCSVGTRPAPGAPCR